MWRKKDNLVPLEKSKRVIHLDKRGRQKTRVTPGVVIFAFLGVLCLLYCLAIGFFMGYGTYFFLIWGVLALGCAGIAFVLWHKAWLERVPGWLKGTVTLCFALVLLLFLVVEGKIYRQFSATAQPGADYVVILGAQWKENGPSYVLQKRLDKAIAYLRENPETKVITTGGQGDNEPMPEAAGMREYLLAAGIEAERIQTEEQSGNTVENLIYGSRYLDKEEDKVVVVTNNFHVFRAVLIARKQGYRNVEGLAADSYPAMLPNNMLREFGGVVKDFMKENL